MFQIKVVDKLKTHILISAIFFVVVENPTVYEIMWKNFVERGRPHDNMAHAVCMVGT